MSKYTIREINATTGEEIVRDATDKEISQFEKDEANLQAAKAETQAKATAKAELLKRLGITAEEAALLLS